jgi:cyclophilin family peptidyl-prolyl cis-trans isomerase
MFEGLESNMRAITVLLSLLMLSPVAGVDYETGDEDWRAVEVDMSNWDDGPELEGSPMDDPRPGDAVLVIEVEYKPGHLASSVQGEIIIELFEEWAPNTTTNMIMHVEDGIYDGIFFHRVIDDFVTQAGDPTCTTVVVYPATNVECGGGGDGHTLVMEHHDNLSHVDGAIGMARSQDPDSADTQWYIAETEAHNLDPENRDDEGYVTFGIVRHGMSHVRAIALVPTSDDPTGEEIIVNPASSAGRPIWEVHISNIDMVGVIPSDETDKKVDAESFFSTTAGQVTIILGAIVFAVVIIATLTRARQEEPDAILLDTDEQDPS